MKIAITGGAGFIGSHLTTAYLDAGHDVLVIDTLAHGKRQEIDRRARFYQMDIRDPKLRGLLQRERPDVVSHHVAEEQRPVGMLDESTLANADVQVHGLLNVLESCVEASVHKCIFASGGNTLYGNSESNQLPLTEDCALSPQLPHDISKLAGEWYVRYYTKRFGLRHTILRYADVYGDATNLHNDHPVHSFLRTLLKQQRPVIRGASDEAHDHIFIDDVLRANLRALEHGNNQTFNISSGCAYTHNQIFEMVANYLESALLPTYISGTLTETHDIVLDNEKAQRLLGWKPEISISEGIWRTGARIQQRTEPITQPLPIPPRTIPFVPNPGPHPVTSTIYP